MKRLFCVNGKMNIVVYILSVLMMAILMSGCSDEDFDEGTDYSEADSYSEESYSEETTDSYDDTVVATERDLSSESDYPHGTADKLEGKTVVVSIFLNDNTTSWDFDSAKDQEMVQTLSKNMKLGMDWIVEQGKRYGKEIEFIYDWDADEELFYYLDLDCDFSSGESQIAEVKTMLDENFKEVSNKLLDKYGAENIIYALYLNEDENTNMTCHAMPFYGTDYGYDMPYEPVCLTNYVYGAAQGPATYAHEILHIFGAPDYYTEDETGGVFGITQDFVEYCQNCDMVNEIMFSTYDPYTNTIPKDKVTNDLTDLTAYYVGWIDEAPLVDEFGLGSGQHQ